MKVGQIQKSIANKLQKTVQDFTLQSIDELIVAMNNARLFAEHTHDFEQSKKLVQLVVDSPQGVDLSNATLYGTITPVKVKSIVNVSVLCEDGSMFPIDYRKRTSVMAELRKITRVESSYFNSRYPPDWTSEMVDRGIREVMQFGRTIMMNPMLASGSLTLVMEAYTLSDDYKNEEPDFTDYFTDYGYNFLIWQGVVECNHLFKEFVFRNEGNLPPPEKLADKYLQAMITNDLFEVAQNVDVTGD